MVEDDQAPRKEVIGVHQSHYPATRCSDGRACGRGDINAPVRRARGAIVDPRAAIASGYPSGDRPNPALIKKGSAGFGATGGAGLFGLAGNALAHAVGRGHPRLIDIVEPTDKTVDALMRLDLAAGVDVEIKLGA